MHYQPHFTEEDISRKLSKLSTIIQLEICNLGLNPSLSGSKACALFISTLYLSLVSALTTSHPTYIWVYDYLFFKKMEKNVFLL